MKATKQWNKMFLIGMVGMALSGIVLMGCASTFTPGDIIVYDQKLSQQEQSVIEIGYFTTAFSFDGTPVGWKATDNVFIPSGSHTLTYSYYSDNGTTIKSAGPFSITYDFKPGEAYYISATELGKQARAEISTQGLLLWKLPPVSTEPTKFEGTWESKDETLVFSGNTLIIEPRKSSGTIYKYVFTFTDKTLVRMNFASRGKNETEWNAPAYSNQYEYKYEFKEDGGLVLIEYGTTYYYKKK